MISQTLKSENDNSFLSLSDIQVNKRFIDFYKSAFEPFSFEIDNNTTVYRIFVGRKCFVTANKYIKVYGSEINSCVLNNIYSDGGLLILAAELAKKYFEIKKTQCDSENIEFNYLIILYDDILIHGRSLSGLLSNAEDVFADTFLKLAKKENISIMEKNELFDVFLNRVIISTAFVNKNPNLLNYRYKKRILKNSENAYEPSVWRKFSYEIAEQIFRLDIPNAAFIPSLCFDALFKSDTVKNNFESAKNIESLVGFRRIDSTYKNRKLNCYIFLDTKNNSLNYSLTIRSTDSYIIPFVFLPPLSTKQMYNLTVGLNKQFNLSFSENKYFDILIDKFQEWNDSEIKSLNVMYNELINTILSSVLLRAFLEELFSYSSLFSSVSLLYKKSTIDLIMYNYANDEKVKKLLEVIYDPTISPILSLSELKDFLFRHIGDSFIYSDIDDITQQDSEYERVENAVERIETIVFDYGIQSEANSHKLLSGILLPSYKSIQRLYLPSQNNLANLLRRLYSYNKSWVRNTFSLYSSFSYILQMMDAGCFSLTVGNDPLFNEAYIQCLKTGEQSLNTIIYRYAEFLPLLDEIERRCYRQGLDPIEFFYDELNDFLFLCKDYLPTENLILKSLKKIEKYSIKHKIAYMMYQIISSGQHCKDFIFLVEKKFSEKREKISAKDYINSVREFYFNTIY